MKIQIKIKNFNFDFDLNFHFPLLSHNFPTLRPLFLKIGKRKTNLRFVFSGLANIRLYSVNGKSQRDSFGCGGRLTDSHAKFFRIKPIKHKQLNT